MGAKQVGTHLGAYEGMRVFGLISVPRPGVFSPVLELRAELSLV